MGRAEERRKRFDTTTPTLIDEDEEDLEFGNLHPPQEGNAVPSSGIRRNPGGVQIAGAVVNLPERDGVQLGFQFGAQGGSGGSQRADSATRIWENPHDPNAHGSEINAASNTDAASSAMGRREQSPFEDTSRPPIARGVASAQSSSGSRSLLSPWKNPISPAAGKAGDASLNMFHLPKDIGIFLRTDEDDDEGALDIPPVNRGGEQDPNSGEFEVDWTGSYVYEAQPHHKSTRRPVARPSTTSQGKSRRRQPAPQVQQQHQATNLFPDAQHPTPVRTSQHPFYFDGGHPADEGESPQMVNFGSGAFVPPEQDMPGAPSFTYRPMASSPAPDSFNMQSLEQSAGNPHSVNFPPGFSFQHFQSVHPPGAPPHGFAAIPSPTPSFASSQQQSSKMQATAQEFVPRSSTPQFPPSPSHWSAGTTATSAAYERDRDWTAQQRATPTHASPAFNFGTSFGYGSVSVSSRTYDGRTMTPSPLWPDVMLYPPSASNQVSHAVASRAASTPTPTFDYPPPGMESSAYMGPSAPNPIPLVSSPTATMAPVQESMVPAAAQAVPVDVKGKKINRNRRPRKPRKLDRGTPSPGPTQMAGASKKKSTKTEVSRPRKSSETSVEEAIASEDDPRKAELEETPATRLAFKNFYKAFRAEEKESFQKAEEFALKALEDGSLPESVHYKVYLELADLAKRSNRYVEARRLYQKVCQLQPYASQGWLEYSKLEEECGFMNRVTFILHAGLEYCIYSEGLLSRAVKHQERMGDLSNARQTLARLKHVGIERVWRTVLEGALLEARAGNSDMARRVLKYLMHHVPWYGPLYLEAYKLERDQGHSDEALQIVQRGLEALPRYGPLWFGAFRLYEEIDLTEGQFHLPKAIRMIERAKLNVSKELVWKVHLEAAQMLERTALIHLSHSSEGQVRAMVPVRRRLVLTILTCPNNLRWKVWLAAGRMELAIGNFETARALFRRAHAVVQQKSRSSTLLDCARLEEFVGRTELARAILCKARAEYGSDWKVWLESVLLEMRNYKFARALEIVGRALEIHTGTGRLWATLVQLQHFIGNDMAQQKALRRALLSVPKSGEVWCEGGRIHLNPFSATFDVDRAKRCLYFATKFTPQFGDSFVESLRVEMLSQWLLPIAMYLWRKTKNSYLAPRGSANLTKYIFDISLAIAIARNNGGNEKHLPQTQYREIIVPLRKKLRYESLQSRIDLTDIRLSCANADPNYGALWFHCRKLPTDTPRKVIENAAEMVAKELFNHAHIYLAAMLRRLAVIATTEIPRPKHEGIESSDPEVIAWEMNIDTKLRDAISLADMLNPVDPTTGLVFLESTSKGSTFVTGLFEMSNPRLIKDLPLYERRRAVFGTDALLP